MKYFLWLFPFLILAQTYKDISFYKGDYGFLDFTLMGNYSTDSVWFVVKADREDATPILIRKRNTAGGGGDSELKTTFVSPNTLFLITLYSVDTEGLTSAIYVYDITADSITIFSGYLKLIDEVSGTADGIATKTPYYHVALDTPLTNPAFLLGMDTDNSWTNISKSAMQDTLKPDANILYVGDNAEYTTISSAITAASSGDVIIIYGGTYTEDIIISDGVTIAGIDRNNSIIDGQVTIGSGTYLYNLTAGTIVSATNDSGYVISCNLNITDTYQINQTGGKLYLSDILTSYNTAQPAINVNDGYLSISNSQMLFQRLLVAGGQVDIYGDVWTTLNSGSYSFRIQNDAILNVDGLQRLYQVDADGNEVYPTNSTELIFENTSISNINNSRIDVELVLDDSAKVYLNDYFGFVNGRFAANTSSTNQCKLIARKFFINMDNGFQSGSHNIEVTSGGEAIYELSDGTIEYMGDQGLRPMIGSASAGGGKQIWNNVTVIDHGGLATGYDNSIYGNQNALINNLTFISYDTTTGKTQRAFVIQANTVQKRTIINSAKFIFPLGYESQHKAIFVNESVRLFNREDSVIINNIQIINASDFEGSISANSVILDSLNAARSIVSDKLYTYNYNNLQLGNDVTIDSLFTANNGVVINNGITSDSIRLSLYGIGFTDIISKSDTALSVAATGSANDTLLITLYFEGTNTNNSRWAEADLSVYVQRNQTDRTDLSALYYLNFAGTHDGTAPVGGSSQNLSVTEKFAADSVTGFRKPGVGGIGILSTTYTSVILYVHNKGTAALNVYVVLKRGFNIKGFTLSKT